MKLDNDIILSVKNIHKKFGSHEIHHNLSFDLLRGQTVGLLGGSGTGKSVLLRSLIGLESIQQGIISFSNQRIDHLTEEELFFVRKKISYSFQSGALFDSLNVFENIAYPLREHFPYSEDEIYRKVKELLELVSLPGKENLMPSDLSGGMQKRVGMARALAIDPEIILYDEPTAGLDPQNTLNVINIMDKLKNRGLTSIFVTHDIPSALSICDRILVLANKNIIFDDTPLKFQESTHPEIRKFFI